MDKRALHNKAKELAQDHTKLREDQRFKKVLGFFVAKGLLFTKAVEPQPTVKLDVADVLWVGEHIEPRVFEVLPAALLHFPKTFLHQEKLSDEFVGIIERIKKDVKEGPDFQGISYLKMRHWARKRLF